MKILNLISTTIFQILSFIFVLGYLLGILNIHFSDKNDYCVMTYMFEYPQFVRLSVDQNDFYPQYGLYAYSEGRLTEKARKMWFDGVPVLFLPGNSGSHMQARSLASVALRKALSNEYDYHFDYFTISYNEELSGLYGGVLEYQTAFAAACVSRILKLYKSNRFTKSVPTSVILIGHSMGGLIAKRLLAHPDTLYTTTIAITLAAPLEAPVINIDTAMNGYYTIMNNEWDAYITKDMEMNQKKLLISFGSGPRDILMPSGLTSSNESYISALTTAIPGVWVSPNHVAIVWCKQLVMSINKYLFSIIDYNTEQIVEDTNVLTAKARQHFQANRSMELSPHITRANITMQADAFWYEDNRRIYQISRPEIDRTTYLMIRLVKFPQNRFVAVETVNVENGQWIFGCNAKYTYNMHRYCQHAISLNELSRWTGSAKDFGRRKLATVNLHSLIQEHPDWTHIIVKVSPTRKPITLNVDINDLESRRIIVNAPSEVSFGMQTIVAETEPESLYYELIVRNFNRIDQAYLLYVEPTASCKATEYHVSAEVHIPWAKNHEYFHYFTHLERAPMKLYLFKSIPYGTNNAAEKDAVKITLLLDPQCKYTISMSTSWYHRLAQVTRNYTPALVPYVAAIVLLAVRANIMNLRDHGTCESIHSALMSEGIKPYYTLVFARLCTLGCMTVPLLTLIFENASWKNLELQYFSLSLWVVPAYMTALGILNVSALAILAAMVFSSQIFNRFLFRLLWRGGSGLAERVASGLQSVPMIVSALLVLMSLACGAAALVVGAAFYAYMLSKMYEEYLEDYVYKLMAKVASRICRFFKPRSRCDKVESQSNLLKESNSNTEDMKCTDKEEEKQRKDSENVGEDVDEVFNNLNFHMMLFLMWLTVTIVNLPALLTWARNFKYNKVLQPDSSLPTGIIMSLCSGGLWQINKPKQNLQYYEVLSTLLFIVAVFILAMGPYSLTIVNYSMTLMFVLIIIQQFFDDSIGSESNDDNPNDNTSNETCENETLDKEIEDHKNNKPSTIDDLNNENGPSTSGDLNNDNKPSSSDEKNINDDVAAANVQSDDCNVCNEKSIYSIFKNLRDKYSFSNDA